MDFVRENLYKLHFIQETLVSAEKACPIRNAEMVIVLHVSIPDTSGIPAYLRSPADKSWGLRLYKATSVQPSTPDNVMGFSNNYHSRQLRACPRTFNQFAGRSAASLSNSPKGRGHEDPVGFGSASRLSGLRVGHETTVGCFAPSWGRRLGDILATVT